jgi:hypothetical protein
MGDRLAGGRQALVRAPFHHRLGREPEASIPRTFDLAVIGRCLAAYERAIAGRL